MSTINKFEELQIWKEARELSLKVFHLTNTIHYEKDYRFKAQIRAAAGSVMDNIAEGFERSGKLELVNFLSFAKGFCGEVKSQLYRAKDQAYIPDADFEELYSRYDRLAANIAGFISYLNKSVFKGQKFKDRT